MLDTNILIGVIGGLITLILSVSSWVLKYNLTELKQRDNEILEKLAFLHDEAITHGSRLTGIQQRIDTIENNFGPELGKFVIPKIQEDVNVAHKRIREILKTLKMDPTSYDL